MNDNLRVPEGQDNFKAQKGIGLYKIRYEMDVKDSIREQNYVAGIISYSSKGAVDTLIQFAKKNVKGFKGMKVDEVSYDGACHALSENVRKAIIKTAINEGLVVDKKDYEVALQAAAGQGSGKKSAGGKKSIIPEKTKKG